MASLGSRPNLIPGAAAAAAPAAERGPQASHLIWGSVDAISNISGEGSSSGATLSGQLENVTFRDWSGSGDSMTHSQPGHSGAIAAAQGLDNNSNRPSCHV